MFTNLRVQRHFGIRCNLLSWHKAACLSDFLLHHSSVNVTWCYFGHVSQTKVSFFVLNLTKITQLLEMHLYGFVIYLKHVKESLMFHAVDERDCEIKMSKLGRQAKII